MFNASLQKNSATLARFDDLKTKNRDPKLTLWQGKNLVLLSCKTNGFLEKIGQIFKAIVFAFMHLFGLLKQDTAKIDEIKQQVKAYRLNQVQDDLESEQKNLLQEIESLKRRIEAGDEYIEAISNEAFNAQQIILDAKIAKIELERLEEIIKHLETKHQILIEFT